MGLKEKKTRLHWDYNDSDRTYIIRSKPMDSTSKGENN